jgi:hypothetical protein
VDALVRLANAFGFTTDELLEGMGGEEPEEPKAPARRRRGK